MPIRVLVDAGHGGNEPGAASNGYIEKDLNLTVALYLKNELQRCGFEVVMTRESDIDIPIDSRGQIAPDNDCTCLASVHFNATGIRNKGKGFEAIHSLNNDSAKWIALCIAKEVEILGLFRRGVWTKESKSYPGKNHYSVLRVSAPIPGVILEGLFLDNDEDVQFLSQPDFLKNLAVAYCKGLCAAYGIQYVPEPINQLDSRTAAVYDQIRLHLKAINDLMQD